MTTVIIKRFMSIASRTWGADLVTSPGVYRKVSCASQSGYNHSRDPPFSKWCACLSSKSRRNFISAFCLKDGQDIAQRRAVVQLAGTHERAQCEVFFVKLKAPQFFRALDVLHDQRP